MPDFATRASGEDRERGPGVKYRRRFIARGVNGVVVEKRHLNDHQQVYL